MPPEGVTTEDAVIRPLRCRTRRTPAEDPEINRALEAMSAPELRAAVHAVLDGLERT